MRTRADGHRTAAEDIERSLVLLGDPAALPFIRRLLIEAYFGAAFHWIAYGMQNAHGKHKENHSKLPTFLNSSGMSHRKHFSCLICYTSHVR